MGKSKWILLVIAGGLFFVLPSCYYDVEEVLYPDDGCDTTNITYSGFIVPLLTDNCYACHGNGASQGGVQMGSYSQLKALVDSGRFLGAVRRDEGFSPMPQGAPQLLDCQIAKIEAWVNEGALDN